MDVFKKLNFSKKTVVTLDNIVVPVPEGLHYSVDSSVIGDHRKLIVVPMNYPFSGDFMSSQIGLSVQYFNLHQRFEVSKSIEIYKRGILQICDFFESDKEIYSINPKEGNVTFYQVYEIAERDIVVHAIKWVDEDAYFIHIHFAGFKIKDVGAFISNGVDWISRISAVNEINDGFSLSIPDEKLYPHYKNMLKADQKSLPGVKFVINQNGTDFEFIPFKRAAEDSDTTEEDKVLYNRIIEKDTVKYTLVEKIKEMQSIFHVNNSAFNPNQDRECEIEKGLLHRAYMMSALRSFAWTLAAYCTENNLSVQSVEIDVLERLVQFIAGRNWLNYSDDSYCKGLCTGSDLHVFFIPEKVSQTDKNQFIPSEKELEEDRAIKETFPSYSPVYNEVHSLEALRIDLEYIYPAIKKIWDKLLATRNYNEALIGDEADIVYAWCSMAYAAKEPFFSQDGPMNCWHEQMNTVASKKPTSHANKTSVASQSSAKKPKSKKKTNSAKIAFLEEDVKDTRKRILMKAKTFRGPVKPKGCDLKLVPLYNDKNNADDILALSIDNLYYSDEHLSKTKELFDAGVKFSSVFHVSDKDFNPYNDRENEILNGYIRASYQLHALRSFGWTGSKYVKSAKKELSDLTIDEAIALADFIESRGGANYKSSIDVTDGFCASLRPKMEYKNCYAGAAFNFYINNKVYALGGDFSGKYCEMYTLVDDLYSLLPIMNEIYEYIAENDETDSTLADILSAWCTFAIATKESFEIVKGDNNCKVARTEVTYESKTEVIKANQNGLYILNGWLVAIDQSKIKNDELVIPEGVEHIFPFEAHSHRCLVNDSFYDIKKLKKITYPSTVKSVCRSSFEFNNIIKEIVLKEGLEQIGNCAFHETDSLEELIIPRSVNFIDNYGFGFSADHPTFKLKIKVYRGSYAERYMKEKGIKHTII